MGDVEGGGGEAGGTGMKLVLQKEERWGTDGIGDEGETRMGWMRQMVTAEKQEGQEWN